MAARGIILIFRYVKCYGIVLSPRAARYRKRYANLLHFVQRFGIKEHVIKIQVHGCVPVFLWRALEDSNLRPTGS